MHEHHHDVPLRVLGWCAILQLIGVVVEFIGGYRTHSLSLTSDAWHMTADIAPATLTLLTRSMIQSRRRLGRLAGFQNKVVAAGVFNSIALMVAGIFALAQSVSVMLYNVRDILTKPAILIALGGLVINLLSYRLTVRYSHAVGIGDTRFDIRALSGHMLMDGISSGLAVICLLLNMLFLNTFWDTIGGMLLGWGMIAYGMILLITEFLRRIET